MGAFILSTNEQKQNNQGLISKGHKSFNSINRPNYSLLISQKILFDNDNYKQYPNRDFIVGIGTFVYQDKFGIDALDDIYTQFDEASLSLPDIYGHFAFVICKRDNIYIFGDTAGIFRIYYYHEGNKLIVSSSLISILDSMDNPTIDEVKLAGFLGSLSGSEIPFISQVDVLSGNYILCYRHQLFELHEKRKSLQVELVTSAKRAVELVESLLATQAKQIKTITESVGSASVEITGGLDSRLMTSTIRKHNIPYDFVHYPLFGADYKVATSISNVLDKPLTTIENKPLNINMVDECYGEFDSGYNFYRHYPNQRWQTPHKIQTSGLLGECISVIQYQTEYKEFRIDDFLERCSISNLLLPDIRDKYRKYLYEYYSLQGYNIQTPIDVLEQSNFIQNLYVQRTGDGLFISGQNSHQYFYSLFNEYHFISSVANIALDIRKNRELTIALIKSIDSTLAGLPFVSHRRTVGKSLNNITNIKERSYTPLKKVLPENLLNQIFRMFNKGNPIKDTLMDNIDYELYAKLINVKKIQKYPRLYSVVLQRLASIEYLRQRYSLKMNK